MYKPITTKEGSSKIVNFITIGAGGLMLGRGYISHCCEYALSSTLPPRWRRGRAFAEDRCSSPVATDLSRKNR